MVGDDLRLHRHVVPGAALLHEFPPVLHAVLRLLEKFPLLLAIDHRQQCLQHRATIADQSDVDVEAQPDARRVDVDLDSLRLAGLRIKLHVRKAASRNEERVALRQRVLRRRGAQQPDSAGGELTVVGHHRLSQQRLDDWRTDLLRELEDFLARAKAAASGENGNLGAGVEHIRCALQYRLGRQRVRGGKQIGAVLVDVYARPVLVAHLPFLNVLGDGDVNDRASRQRRLDRLVHHVVHVRRSHDALIERRDVHEQLVEVDVLLVVHAYQIVKRVARNGEHRLAIALGIVESVEQMDAARPGRRETYTQSARVLGIAACSERSRLLVSHLNERDLLLPGAQRLEDAVDPVTGKSENRVNAPCDEPFDEEIGDRVCHLPSSPMRVAAISLCRFDSKRIRESMQSAATGMNSVGHSLCHLAEQMPSARLGRSGGLSGGMFNIRCDITRQGVALPHVWEQCVGSGHATLALRADYQAQLARCHAELGMQRVRFHGLLCDDMGTLVCERNEFVHSFVNADRIWDFLLSIGMRPFVELSFMPSALSSGAATVFHYRGNVTPPKDPALWATLIQLLGQHCVDRYGAAEIREWFFEVWNEPNLQNFWRGSRADYFELYHWTAEALKRADDGIRVGGPASASNGWIESFLDYCETNRVPVDF